MFLLYFKKIYYIIIFLIIFFFCIFFLEFLLKIYGLGEPIIKENILFYNLIKEFKKITGVPVLINTSFNIRGEPIVCSVKDAYDCFMGTNLDILVVNNFILYKHHQTEKISYEYKSKYKLD